MEQALNGAARVRFRQCLFDNKLECMVPVTAPLVAPGNYGGRRHILRSHAGPTVHRSCHSICCGNPLVFEFDEHFQSAAASL